MNAHVSIDRPAALERMMVMMAMIMLTSAAIAQTDTFSASALRGVQRVHIVIEGIDRDFSRYGLTAEQLRENTARRLSAYGLEVIGAEGAVAEADASQFLIKLYTNEDPYSLLSYGLSVRLNRKVPLDREGLAFVSQTVWSQGQHGILNPSDLPRVYAFVADIVEQFLAAHGKQN